MKTHELSRLLSTLIVFCTTAHLEVFVSWMTGSIVLYHRIKFQHVFRLKITDIYSLVVKVSKKLIQLFEIITSTLCESHMHVYTHTKIDDAKLYQYHEV
jgi:hypothetical protein